MKGFCAYLLVLCVLLGGCKQEDNVLADQQKRIVSYLRSTHSPRLVPEEQVGEEPVAFYSEAGNTLYRYISIDDYYNPDRPSCAEVTTTSRVGITFRAYVFSYANIVTSGTSQTMPYYTNDPVLREPLINAGLSVEYWKFEPLEINMGQEEILKGLYPALLGCREGDRVEVYMTNNMAYGKENFGVVPRESPVALLFTINSVQ